MRGSPLLRTILILAALVVSGIGFARLTRKEVAAPVGDAGGVMAEEAVAAGIPAKVHLSFSGLPGSIELNTGDEDVILRNDKGSDFSGSASIDPANPVVFLKAGFPVRGNRQFAKLTVEAEGKETFTHVFDAEGDIDDFVELPF